MVQSAADKTLAESLAGWQERYPEVTVHRVFEFEQPARHLLDQAERAQLVEVGDVLDACAEAGGARHRAVATCQAPAGDFVPVRRLA